MNKLQFIFIFWFLMHSSVCRGDFALRQCEPIKIDLCRNIGYNETSMPNLVGNELQSDAEYILQTFSPLIEYVCSSQLKLFLCATYVPMCTPKVPVPIGPCRTLCESVRSRCHPVLQGFGYPWPPALDCHRFPKENNHETMCMEGPGEVQEAPAVKEMYPANPAVNTPFQPATVSSTFECPGHSKLYVKLHRSGRCAPLCEANILFGPNEKHIAELWTHTWTYAAAGLSLLATISLLFSDSRASKLQESSQIKVLSSLMWSHTMVAIGWTVRFIAGRTATSCGFDPQLPNVSLLLVDGLSNAPCATTFILRYYFGMAACAWWAILCLGWHRDVRRISPDSLGHMTLGTNVYPSLNNSSVTTKLSRKIDNSITSSNLARFLAWGLPAFQTAAVIVARLVDADELLGACYVGNQSDKGLQILVATPLFCYWIFGSMNLASGFLVYRRNRDILRNTNSTSLQLLLQTKCSISGVFLFIYCLPYALLLLSVIYEFANIDVWLSESPYGQTPEWPFLTRAFMELVLCIICSACILGPKISSLYKRQLSAPPNKLQEPNMQAVPAQHKLIGHNCNNRVSNNAYSTTSYQTVREPKKSSQYTKHFNNTISMNQLPNYCPGRTKTPKNHVMYPHLVINSSTSCNTNSLHRYGDETIL
ncbi:frizzled-4 isoform X1 [Lucilia sericata]|uniref:frizzled-4 isoform X1 n=1 Tax=Lucilia sericata TaxID=13632 RepID=UPI0018A82491|nr:frizzled-4 isoform X1 [Lucilia sericata]XP_037828860.1 frizzled-4 isoform X1 [Lucilia sericata]